MHRMIRAEANYKLKNDDNARQTVTLCNKQTQVAEKNYAKLLKVKKEAVLGKTHNPRQAERRHEVLAIVSIQVGRHSALWPLCGLLTH